MTALKGWVGLAPQGRGALHIIILTFSCQFIILYIINASTIDARAKHRAGNRIMAVTKGKTKKAGGQDKKHDRGYRDVLSNSATFLHFMRKYFAKSWTANISADDIQQVNTSFITDKYRLLDSDLIYKLKINGSDVYFYVLIELQSEVDFTMPFRLLQYMVALLSHIFNNTDNDIRERKGFRLPAIVPIVLYNGKDKWTPPLTYGEYTEDCGMFGDNIINFRYLLFDLNRMDDDVIEPIENPLDAVFVVEKLRIRKRLTSAKLTEWWTENTSGFSNDHIDTLITWINHNYWNGKMTPETLEILKNNPKKGRAVMKTLMDEWVEQGAHKWMRKGGKQKALEIAKRLKIEGLSVDAIARATDLTVDDVLRL